jgi:lysozyme
MNAIDLVKKFEGLSLKSYQYIGGVWTIGYGSTGPDIGPNMTWSEQDADQRLNLDVMAIENQIKKLVVVPLTENQEAALTSFVYNEGIGHLESSTLLKMLNDKDYNGAADQFLRWVKVDGQSVDGLKNRRTMERQIFLTP